MKFVLSFILVLSLFGCKKTIENIQKNIVIDAMTTGQWKVVIYKEGSVERTAEFLNYAFQFYEANSVEAYYNGTLEKTGSWSANTEAKTITAYFTTTNTPLVLLNGTWKVVDNSWTFVEVTQDINGTLHLLRIEKI